MERLVGMLKKFGKVHVESEREIVVKTEPFHTLVAKHGPFYMVYGPGGVYRARDEHEVIRALRGQKKPDMIVPPLVVPFLENLRADVKLFVGASIVARVPSVGRDLYILVPKVLFTGQDEAGEFTIMSSRIGENSVLGDVVRIRYAGYQDAVRKLASIIMAINSGDIKEIYRTWLQ